MKNMRDGFTLMEMAVVLVIIAIITATAIVGGQEILESTRKVATENKLNAIETALANFRAKYGRLPCPGNSTLAESNASYGLEAANNAGTCTGGTPAATYITLGAPTGIPSGSVPTRTLGLPDNFMYDGWERKFHYEVTPAMTRTNAFSYSQPYDSCSITIKDHSNTSLATNAVYALVSYGRNGMGGYIAGGTQFTDGTAGTAEQTNIRTTTNTPTIRAKNGESGALGTAGYYDDIVRFKQRYQMMDATDRATPIYRGPELVLGFNTTTSPQLVYGKAKCDQWQPATFTVPTLPSQEPRFIGFTPGNTNLVVYFDGDCNLYSISRTTLTALTDFATCPADATRGTMAKDSGTLALNQTASPYVRVYKLAGSGSSAAYGEIVSALSPAAAYAPTHMTMSANGEYFTISKSGSASVLYSKNVDDSYQVVLAPPWDAKTEVVTAISPDGNYFALTVLNGSDTDVFLYRNVSGAFTQVGASAVYSIVGMTLSSQLVFSPDSSYLAVTGTGSANRLAVLYINPVTEAVSAALAVTLSDTPADVAFSKDGAFLAVTRSNANGKLTIYRRNGTASFDSTADTLGSFTFHASANANAIGMSR